MNKDPIAQALGSRGGKKTLEKYGPAHYSKLAIKRESNKRKVKAKEKKIALEKS